MSANLRCNLRLFSLFLILTCAFWGIIGTLDLLIMTDYTRTVFADNEQQPVVDQYDGAVGVNCDQGAVNAPNSQMFNLDESADAWGIFCEGLPTWVLTDVSAPSLDGTALRCGITGGDAYSNVHCYRNLEANPDARYFVLSLSFLFTPTTTCGNDGDPAIVQAIEFSMSKWEDEKRYEFAVQWQNVGEGAPQWRYWDPHQMNRWVPFTPPITQCLTAGWHTLTLTGMITGSGDVNYHSFQIDDQAHMIDDISVSSDDDSGVADKLAVAVQLDGNADQAPYDVFIDQVHFMHQWNLFLPAITR